MGFLLVMLQIPNIIFVLEPPNLYAMKRRDLFINIYIAINIIFIVGMSYYLLTNIPF